MTTFIEVFSDALILQFCSLECWLTCESEVALSYGLHTIYPKFEWVAHCCACSKYVHRVKPYVSLNIYELVEETKPWLTSASLIDDNEFAVLCNICSKLDDFEAQEMQTENDELELVHRSSNLRVSSA